MNGFEALEKRKRAVTALVVVLCAATLFVTAMRAPASYDAFWHLQMGKDWIENGLSPWADHYSFTFRGSEISAPPVAFQALLYGLVDAFGEYGGFFVYKLGAFLLALAMMMLWLRRIRAPTLAWCLVLPLLTFLLQLRVIARPELISYSLAILAMVLYQRARTELSFRAMAPIALLLLAWTNYHSSFIAYVVFFGLFVDIAIRLIREKAPPGAWGAFILVPLPATYPARRSRPWLTRQPKFLMKKEGITGGHSVS